MSSWLKIFPARGLVGSKVTPAASTRVPIVQGRGSSSWPYGRLSMQFNVGSCCTRLPARVALNCPLKDTVGVVGGTGCTPVGDSRTLSRVAWAGAPRDREPPSAYSTSSHA